MYYKWFYHKGKRKGETLEIFQKPLTEVPIKYVETKEQEPIVSLVKEIIDLKRKNQKTDVTDLEKKIDQLVYDLYDIKKEQQDIVEGK